MSDSVRPHRRQPTRLRHPWDSPGKNTGVGCHFLLQCMKEKSESEVAQLCLTVCDPMDCSLPGSSVHGFTRQEYWSGVPLGPGFPSSPRVLPTATAAVLTPLVEPLANTGEVLLGRREEAHVDNERFEKVWPHISFLLKSLVRTLTERLSLGCLAAVSTPPCCASFPWSQWCLCPGLSCGPVLRWIILWVMLLRVSFLNFPTFGTFALFLLHH